MDSCHSVSSFRARTLFLHGEMPWSNWILGFLALLLVCTNNEDMQYAGTMMTSVYGMMSMVGGLFAGYAAATYGVDACYLMDSFTYFLSSAIMATCVRGNFKRTYNEHDHNSNESKQATDKVTDQPVKQVEVDVEVPTVASSADDSKDTSKGRFVLRGELELFHYLRSSGVGMLVFMKATDSLIWGPGDIIGIEMSTIYKPDGVEDESATSYRMGLYYACMGLGVFLGPSVSNYFSDAKRPSTIQRACVIAIFVAGVGWTGSYYAPDFHWFLVFQAICGLAFGTLWSYSTLLLQLLVDDGILGRVFSVEYFLYVMAETISSSATGPLYDAGFSSEDLCLFGASLAFVTFAFWATYHWIGKGATRAEFNDVLHPKKGQPPVDSSVYSFYDIQYRETGDDNKSVVSRASARRKVETQD